MTSATSSEAPRGLTRHRWPWAVAAAALAALIFVLSSGPVPVGLPPFPHADKVVHFGVYGLLAALLTPATGRPWVAIVLATLYGVSDEVHQSFVPGRDASLLDLLADLSGATVCAFIFFAWLRRRGN